MNAIENQQYIITTETPLKKIIQHYDIQEGKEKELLTEQINFFDNYGNTIKRFSFYPAKGGKTSIEREYIYYE